MRAEPEKNPVPKNATTAPRIRITIAFRAIAYSGTRSAVSSRYTTNDLRRPRRSATQPKLRYPGNIPARLRNRRRAVVPINPKPRPPCSTGSERYGGIQLNKPHHPNSPKKFISKRKKVGRTKGARNKDQKLLLPELSSSCDATTRCCFHISDSGTLRRIHSVTSAGMMPTKNTARQLA